jgi:hypothetical protein
MNGLGMGEASLPGLKSFAHVDLKPSMLIGSDSRSLLGLTLMIDKFWP